MASIDLLRKHLALAGSVFIIIVVMVIIVVIIIIIVIIDPMFARQTPSMQGVPTA